MLLSPILSRFCPMDSSMLTRLVLHTVFFFLSQTRMTACYYIIMIENNGSNTTHSTCIQFIGMYVPLCLFLPYIISALVLACFQINCKYDIVLKKKHWPLVKCYLTLAT